MSDDGMTKPATDAAAVERRGDPERIPAFVDATFAIILTILLSAWFLAQGTTGLLASRFLRVERIASGGAPAKAAAAPRNATREHTLFPAQISLME